MSTCRADTRQMKGSRGFWHFRRSVSPLDGSRGAGLGFIRYGRQSCWGGVPGAGVPCGYLVYLAPVVWEECASRQEAFAFGWDFTCRADTGRTMSKQRCRCRFHPLWKAVLPKGVSPVLATLPPIRSVRISHPGKNAQTTRWTSLSGGILRVVPTQDRVIWKAETTG